MGKYTIDKLLEEIKELNMVVCNDLGTRNSRKEVSFLFIHKRGDQMLKVIEKYREALVVCNTQVEIPILTETLNLNIEDL